MSEMTPRNSPALLPSANLRSNFLTLFVTRANCAMPLAPMRPGPGTNARGRERLELMVKTTDGQELAEKDLEMRGAGELWGTMQSGMPRLKLADLSRDGEILARAKAAAAALVHEDPRLLRPEHGALRTALLSRYPEPLELALAG